MSRILSRVLVLAAMLAGVATIQLLATASASAQTTAETDAVNWAVGQIGSTSGGSLCLSFVQTAYDHAGINIQNDTSGVTWNRNTDPEDVWGHTTTGTTGTGAPPYGALVFFNAKSGYDPEDYSHVTIMGANGEMISTNDAYNENDVHYETLAQEQGSGAYATYVGWWLPDGTTSAGGGLANGTFVQISGSAAIYEIVGGAPLYVSSWNAFGGQAQPFTAISQQQFDSLAQYPANGTAVYDGVSGAGYIFAGGAPLYVDNWADVGNP